MRKLVLLLLAAAPALAAQSIVTVPAQQCVWRAGDDPAWAAPSLDDSAWLPLPSWQLNPSLTRLWVRCRIDSASFANLNDPALEISMDAAYESFLDGTSVARNGNLENGGISMDRIRIFPVPRQLVTHGTNVLAVRMSRRYSNLFALIGFAVQTQIRLGETLILANDRAAFIEGQLPDTLLSAAPYIILGVIGTVLLAISLVDHTRIAPIVLSAGCIAVGLVFATIVSGSMMVNEPAWLYAMTATVASAVSIDTQYWFPFALAGRRIPRIFWLPMGVMIFSAAWTLLESMVPLSAALRLNLLADSVINPAVTVAQSLLGSASLVAFWPWRQVPPLIRPIAALSIAWGVNQSIFFTFLLTAFRIIPGLPNIFQSWMFPASTVVEFFVVAAIIALNLREQRQVALQRAALAGEMQAASDIQRMLAPATIETAPELRIEVAFHPMREVGGDFYLCRVLASGHQRVLLGDVSGKGAAAAMAATLLLGAAAARDSDSPAKLLEHMNRALKENHLGGFATCVCADISPHGTATLANAGHLAPYCNGDELKIESALPLGIAANTEYVECILSLAPGDRLSFLSDGVVEARNSTGELFGFDRTASISTQSAWDIAAAAQSHGQEDDITVLTLIRLPVAPETASDPTLRSRSASLIKP